MKKLLVFLLCMFCLTGVTLPAVMVYAEEKATIATPSKPTVTNIVDSIRVKWTAVDGVTKYGVWRSETGKNGTYKWLGNPAQNSYLDQNVTSGKTYFYKITCMDSSTGYHGAKSEAGGVAYVSTPDITQRFNKAVGVVLQWDKIEGATGYAIYRKSYAGSDAWARIATIEGNETFTYTDTSVSAANGTVYRYTIRALAGSDMKTLSGCRNTGRTMVRLTSRVLNSATATASDSIKCSWITTAQATGYEVRFMVGETVIKTVTIGNYKTGTKTFTGLIPETTYKVQVRSYKKVDGVGSFYSAWSVEKYVTTPSKPTATPKPTATSTPTPTSRPTAVPDTKPPVVDISSLTISKSTVTVGESVSFSIKITDDVSGVDRAFLVLRRPVSGDTETVSLWYNETTGKYEGSFTVGNTAEEGIWKIREIDASDKDGHWEVVYNSEVVSQGTNLSDYDFAVQR